MSAYRTDTHVIQMQNASTTQVPTSVSVEMDTQEMARLAQVLVCHICDEKLTCINTNDLFKCRCAVATF